MNAAMKYYQQLLPLLRSSAAWKIALQMAIAVLLLSIIFYTAERYRGRKNHPDIRIEMSVYNSGSSGTMALREFLGRSGLETGKVLRPLTKFTENASGENFLRPGSVIIIDPRKDLTEADIASLCRFGGQGASVFIFARQESLFRHLFSYDAHWKKREIFSGKALVPVTKQETSSLRFTTGGFEDIRALTLPDKWRFKAVPKHWQSLASDTRGTIALYRPAGKGHFITVSGSLFLSNIDIRKSDNGLFAYRLIRKFHKSGALYFDEYHHGYSTRYTLLYFITRSEYFNIIIHIIIFLVLLTIPAGIRFGQYRKKPVMTDEKIYYFSEGIAGLLQKHRHYGGILEMMIDNYRKNSAFKPDLRSGEKLKQLHALRKLKAGGKTGKSDIRKAYTIIKGE
jgi:hypothetical protein